MTTQALSGEAAAAAQVAETYYDSQDADQFYFNVWGGQDIHIGLYELDSEDIALASARTVAQMAALADISAGQHVVDLGAGYGGAARYVAQRFGARVTAVNLSEVQNTRNRELSAEAGLGDKVSVLHASFEQVPLPDGCANVVWSQDAFLHSGDRSRVLREARRLLAPGGRLIFTDPMQADTCPADVLGAVYDRLHLTSLGSIAFYRQQAAGLGFQERDILDLSPQLGRHYGRVHEELSRRRRELEKVVSPSYVANMLAGLRAWTDAAKKGYLAWGILQFEVP